MLGDKGQFGIVKIPSRIETGNKKKEKNFSFMNLNAISFSSACICSRWNCFCAGERSRHSRGFPAEGLRKASSLHSPRDIATPLPKIFSGKRSSLKCQGILPDTQASSASEPSLDFNNAKLAYFVSQN